MHVTMWFSVLVLLCVCTLTESLSLSWIGVATEQRAHIQHGTRSVGTSMIRTRRQADGESNLAEIKSLQIVSKIQSRFSETVVNSDITNPTDQNQNAVFNLEIPERAFISNFSMVIDGQLLVTEVKSKADADKLYEEAKNKNKTAGKVESTAPIPNDPPQRGMERFKVAFTVKAKSSISFELTYLQLLERVNGHYQQVVSMRPGQIVPDFKVDVYIYDKQGIDEVSIFEPSLGTNSLEFKIAEVFQESKNLRHVVFHPSPSQQREMDPKLGVNRELLVSYDVVHGDDAGLVNVDSSYFGHFFSPDEGKYSALDKNIVFVIDTSGSMMGTKINQTAVAFRRILAKLRKGDSFLLLFFDDDLTYWPANKKPVLANTDNVIAAQTFAASNLVADGGTNIADAVTTACSILIRQENPKGSSYVIFLTDGDPTVGETNPDRIVSMVVDAAGNDVAVFSLAFGENVRVELLEKLAYRTGGDVHNIYEDDDSADQLEVFYNRVETPLMYEIEIEYPADVVDQTSLTTTSFKQFFSGSELVVVGKLADTSVTLIKAIVTADAKKGTSDTQEISISSDGEADENIPTEVATQDGFMEKLYVYMRIKFLLKEKLLTDDKTKQKEAEDEALQLALKYRFVTPLTSMIIVQVDGDPMSGSVDEADEHYGWSAAGVMMSSPSGSDQRPILASNIAASIVAISYISGAQMLWFLVHFLS